LFCFGFLLKKKNVDYCKLLWRLVAAT